MHATLSEQHNASYIANQIIQKKKKQKNWIHLWIRRQKETLDDTCIIMINTCMEKEKPQLERAYLESNILVASCC